MSDWKVIRRRQSGRLGNEACITNYGKLYLPRHMLETTGMGKAHRIVIEVNQEQSQAQIRLPKYGDQSLNAITQSRTGAILSIRESLRQLNKKVPTLSTKVPAITVENRIIVTLEFLEDCNG